MKRSFLRQQIIICHCAYHNNPFKISEEHIVLYFSLHDVKLISTY